jgi:hypothetical protein
MALHVYAQEWLYYISKNSRKTSPERHNQPQTPKMYHGRPMPKYITHLGGGSGGEERRARGYGLNGC